MQNKIQTKLTSKQKETRLAYYYANRSRFLVAMRKYGEDNKQELSKKRKERYQLNKSVILERNKKWREDNAELLSLIRKKEYTKNKRRYSAYGKRYLKQKLETDRCFKFKHALRSRLRTAIKNRYKSGSAVRDMGCSGEDAYRYIESLFTEGMSWENHGKWHIDHIKPLSSFDLEDREQFLEAVNYKNLQPLWASENLSKNDRI